MIFVYNNNSNSNSIHQIPLLARGVRVELPFPQSNRQS